VVAIEHHMAVVHLGDGVDGIGVQVRGFRAFGRAVELHAFGYLGRKNIALFEEHQVGVIVAERVLRLQVQMGFEAHALAQQGLFDLGQEVFAAQKELHRLVELVYQVALGIFQTPHQAHDTG